MAAHHLLFPGRHHLLTRFQMDYLREVCAQSLQTRTDVNGRPLALDGCAESVIWAVTSANHANTRHNPLPGHRREAAIADFERDLGVDSFVYLIDDIGATPRFAEYVLKKIAVDSQNRFVLTPQNTVVACSTPAVIEMYERLGFQVLAVELAQREPEVFAEDTPWDILMKLVAGGRDGWRSTVDFVERVAPASQRLYLKYGFGDHIVDLHAQELLTDDGDITETRDYNTYVRSFDDGARRKADVVRDHVRPGRIVDIGCCTGALLQELTADPRLHESDFYGIEVARQLYSECLHRKEQGHFANDHVFFYQRDFAAGPIFPDRSVDTALTFALTHEIESYIGRDALVEFIQLITQQLADHGRWMNVDVIGPPNPDAQVYVWLCREDGRTDDHDRRFEDAQRDTLRDYLDGLSTWGRFLRFAGDFRSAEGYRLQYELQDVAGAPYAVMRLGDACEFLSKKDYTDNWLSEMHETFCFWSFDEWKQAVVRAGLRVHPASRAYTNPWLVDNRYRGRAEFFTMHDGQLVQMPYPVTNMLLIADRMD